MFSMEMASAAQGSMRVDSRRLTESAGLAAGLAACGMIIVAGASLVGAQVLLGTSQGHEEVTAVAMLVVVVLARVVMYGARVGAVGEAMLKRHLAPALTELRAHVATRIARQLGQPPTHRLEASSERDVDDPVCVDLARLSSDTLLQVLRYLDVRDLFHIAHVHANAWSAVERLEIEGLVPRGLCRHLRDEAPNHPVTMAGYREARRQLAGIVRALTQLGYGVEPVSEKPR